MRKFKTYYVVELGIRERVRTSAGYSWGIDWRDTGYRNIYTLKKAMTIANKYHSNPYRRIREWAENEEGDIVSTVIWKNR